MVAIHRIRRSVLPAQPCPLCEGTRYVEGNRPCPNCYVCPDCGGLIDAPFAAHVCTCQAEPPLSAIPMDDSGENDLDGEDYDDEEDEEDLDEDDDDLGRWDD